jgi:hypothetical protein
MYTELLNIHTQCTVHTFLHVPLKQIVKTCKRFHIVQVSTDLLLEYILARVTKEILYFQNSKIL